MKGTAIALVFLAIVAAGPVHALAKPPALNVALLDFSSNNVPTEHTENVKNRIMLRLITSGSVTVLESRKTQETLLAQNREDGSLNDTKTAAQIGRFLKADYVIFGALDRITATGDHIIYVRVVDSATGAIQYADSETFSSLATVLQASDALASRLLKAIGALPRIDNNTGLHKKVWFSLHLTGSYVHPIGDFASVAGSGGAVLVAPGVSFQGLFVGIRTGYIGYSSQKSYQSASVIPITLMLLYSFTLPRSFTVDLTASGGVSFNKLEGEGLFRHGFAPFVMGGAYIGYAFHKSVRFFVGFECGAVLESRHQIFLSGQAGCMFGFR